MLNAFKLHAATVIKNNNNNAINNVLKNKTGDQTAETSESWFNRLNHG